jgi:CheY-like chemotaxis protein
MSGTILIVDDSPIIRHTLRSCIERCVSFGSERQSVGPRRKSVNSEHDDRGS